MEEEGLMRNNSWGDFSGSQLPKERRGRQKRDGYGKKETKVSLSLSLSARLET